MAEQRWDPAAYARSASFVPRLGQAVLELLAVRPGERVLDLGCGDGALTEELLRLGADVVGVDSSPEMVRAAPPELRDAVVDDAVALAAPWLRDRDGNWTADYIRLRFAAALSA